MCNQGTFTDLWCIEHGIQGMIWSRKQMLCTPTIPLSIDNNYQWKFNDILTFLESSLKQRKYCFLGFYSKQKRVQICTETMQLKSKILLNKPWIFIPRTDTRILESRYFLNISYHGFSFKRSFCISWAIMWYFQFNFFINNSFLLRGKVQEKV